MEKEIKYLEEVRKKILEPRKDALIEILLNFIDNTSKTLIKEAVRNNYELKVVEFEFDQPFTFSYVAYPGSNLIPSEYTNTISDNLEIEDAASEELENIFEKLGFESFDGIDWYNESTSEYFNQHKLCGEMECLWFHECWQIAKGQSLNSFAARCFFIEHDDFGGIDADSGLFLTEIEKHNSLADEGLFIRPTN